MSRLLIRTPSQAPAVVDNLYGNMPAGVDIPGYIALIGGGQPIRYSHENRDVTTLYAEYPGHPPGHKSHHLLHTNHHEWEMPKNPKLK